MFFSTSFEKQLLEPFEKQLFELLDLRVALSNCVSRYERLVSEKQQQKNHRICFQWAVS